MTEECPECRAGLEHCHGTVIIHPLLPAECTEPDCDRRELLHTLRVDCDAVGCACARVSETSRAV